LYHLEVILYSLPRRNTPDEEDSGLHVPLLWGDRHDAPLFVFYSRQFFRTLLTMRKPLEPWRRNLYIIWASQFIAMMGMSLVVPFLPFFIRDLGVRSTDEVARWSGLVFAGPFFVSFFTTPIWGSLGDRYGRKAMTVRAIFGLGISQILVGSAQSVEMLFLFRMIQGGISGFLAAALALVSANTPREHSGYAVGLLQTATSSGNVLGPLVGGSLADAFGFRPIFFIVAGLCTIAGVLIVKFVKEEHRPQPGHSDASSFLGGYAHAFRSKPIRTALVVIVISQSSVFMIQPIFALYVESLISKASYVATLTGGIFSIAGVFTVLAAPWWGKRNDTKSYKKNLTIALSGAGVAYMAQGLVSHAFQLIVLRAILGFCLGGMLPTLYSYISKNASLERRGSIMGIAASGNILANMIGPPAGGFIASHVGLRETFYVTGGMLILTVLYVRSAFIDMRGSEFQAPLQNEETQPALAESASE
jgi:DHA1 family multidrug resistance protein-like MFS transporter